MFVIIAKVSSAKFEVEKILIVEIEDAQQRLHKVLAEKAKNTRMSDESWEDLDVRALNIIPPCLVEDVFFNIVEVTTKGLWSQMKSLYITKSMTNRIYLKRKLYSLQMKEGTKIVNHLNVFNTLMCQFTSICFKIKEEDKAVMLLCPFLDSWDHLVTTISYSTATNSL